jgi:MerR family transcriptional regulator, copper efflux regulator
LARALLASARLIRKPPCLSAERRCKPSYHGKVNGFLDMNIGAAAAASGVNAKMIRHYEAIGLLRPVQRRRNAYRDYGERDIHELSFISRARRLGFSIPEIGALLALWRDRGRPSRDVRRIAEAHIGDLEQRIAEMQAMAKTLGKLIGACHGDERPDCPILDDLAGDDAGRNLNRILKHAI